MADKYLMNSSKMLWHMNKVHQWQSGKTISPIHIDVGLSKNCNIKCCYCFGNLQGNKYNAEKLRFFPKEPLLEYMRSAGKCGVNSIALIGEAEPLLNPHVYDAIIEGSNTGIDMSLGTNGILYEKNSLGMEALKKLVWLRFNISAASYEAYKKVHNSELFAMAIDRIDWCVETKRKYKLKTTIGLQMVLVPENADQVIPLAKLGKDLGVDYLVIKQCSDTVDSQLGIYNQFGGYSSYKECLMAAENMSDDNYQVIVKWKAIENCGSRCYKQCLATPFLLYSSGDGKVYPCGMFFEYREDEFCMGDLCKQSFEEIINSQRYKDVIEKVKQIDVSTCYSNCKSHSINEFLHEYTNPPEHVNFV